MSVRNLCFLLDNTLAKKKQMNFRFKSCYYKIQNMRLKYINNEKTSPTSYTFPNEL